MQRIATDEKLLRMYFNAPKMVTAAYAQQPSTRDDTKVNHSVARPAMMVARKLRKDCGKMGLIAALLVAPVLHSHAVAAGSGDGVRAGWSLERLLEAMMDAHPTIKARRANIAAAEADVDGARWQFYPTPSVSAEHFEGERKVIFGLRQPLWTGGRLTAGLDVARGQLGVATVTLQEVRYELAQRVVSAWVAVLSASGRREALRVGLAQLVELESMMKRRVGTGYSADVELNLVHARIAQMRGDITQVQGEERGALEGLSQLVGVSIQTDDLAMSDMYRVDAPVQGLLDRALAVNPAIRRAAAERDAAVARLDQARTQFMPTLSLRYEFQRGAILGSLPAGSRVYVNFEHSFGAGLATISGVRAAEATRDAAEESLEAARRELSARLAADLEGWRAATGRVEAFTLNVADMERVSVSYRNAFEAGKRGWLDLLNMIRERTDAAQQLAISRVQAVQHAFQLRLYAGEFL